ncbi:Zinc finger CCCH domain-containing protein 20 [Bienertia sinuspersici]
MMMIHGQHPTVEVPPWDSPYEDPTTPMFSPQTNDYFSALKRYLPSSEFDDSDNESSDLPFDAFSCDNFRMYEFKVRKCARGRSHDWTECPYAHPGEKARRRDPRKYHYSGTACPDFRRGSCRKGDACEFSHGVFECWLHPARYRTQPCKDGPHCKRRVCFFAHSPDQLRVLPNLSESPPSRLGGGESLESSPPARRMVGYSPTSVFETFPESPPLSPSYGVNELANAMRELQIKKFGMGPTHSTPSRNVWAGLQMGSPSSPRGGYMGPTTPCPGRAGLFDPSAEEEEEVPMERVESGKDLRARIYAKLSKENSLVCDRVDSVSSAPDFGWVSELVK